MRRADAFDQTGETGVTELAEPDMAEAVLAEGEPVEGETRPGVEEDVLQVR